MPQSVPKQKKKAQQYKGQKKSEQSLLHCIFTLLPLPFLFLFLFIITGYTRGGNSAAVLMAMLFFIGCHTQGIYQKKVPPV